MIATLTGVLFITASAAGWLLIVLVAVDVLRQSRAAAAWRPDPPQGEDMP